jgi:hypothetical protein
VTSAPARLSRADPVAVDLASLDDGSRARPPFATHNGQPAAEPDCAHTRAGPEDVPRCPVALGTLGDASAVSTRVRTVWLPRRWLRTSRPDVRHRHRWRRRFLDVHGPPRLRPTRRCCVKDCRPRPLRLQLPRTAARASESSREEVAPMRRGSRREQGGLICRSSAAYVTLSGRDLTPAIVRACGQRTSSE